MHIRDQIVEEAKSWIGTPYHHCADVKGAGVDCLMILVKIYQAVGLTPPGFDPRPYSTQWHLHRSEELYLNGLSAKGAVLTDSPKIGDIGIWKFARTFSHAGVLIQPKTVLHALRSAGCVTLTDLDEDPLVNRAVKWYSVVPLEQ